MTNGKVLVNGQPAPEGIAIRKGQHATFVCEGGFDLEDGPRRLECIGLNQYDSNWPRCVEGCKVLEVRNGHVVFDRKTVKGKGELLLHVSFLAQLLSAKYHSLHLSRSCRRTLTRERG